MNIRKRHIFYELDELLQKLWKKIKFDQYFSGWDGRLPNLNTDD